MTALKTIMKLICILAMLIPLQSVFYAANAADTEYDWLVYVYLCGSDLESESGMGTADLSEMLEASTNGRAAFLVEAGGTKTWQNDILSSSEQTRLLIADGDISVLDTFSPRSMGKADTLADFAACAAGYGLHAQKSGLVLWNHGSGSINGVCFDENFDDDSLTLEEIDRALTQSRTAFEFIGFDACLMGTYETAAMLRHHTPYMIASEETEAGDGWDYRALGTAMGQNMDTITLGKGICDSFYESCKAVDEDPMATLALIDLRKMDPLIQSFDAVCVQMLDNLSSPTVLGGIANGFKRAENYGGNNRVEGYTNMVDLGDILDNIVEYIPSAAKAKAALEDAVIYRVNGFGRANAHGLAVYYPLYVEGSEELQIFEAQNPNRNYVRFTKCMLYGASKGSPEDYTDARFRALLNDTMSSENGAGLGLDSGSFLSMLGDNTHTAGDAYNGPLTFAEKPHLNADGYFTFTLTEESLDCVQTVGLNLFQMIDENEDVLFYLGNDNNVEMNWQSGVGTDNFYGIWPSLPDGQELMFFLLEEKPEYSLYTTPVQVNGIDKYLRFSWVWDDPYSEDNTDGEFTILGLWDGMDEDTGAASKGYETLEAGSVLCPIYYGYTDEEENIYYGEEYTVTENMEITEKTLREGIYSYCFDIVDTFGNALITDSVEFYVTADGEVELL